MIQNPVVIVYRLTDRFTIHYFVDDNERNVLKTIDVFIIKPYICICSKTYQYLPT